MASVAQPSDLRLPCVEDTLLEIRTSGMKRMPGLQIESGIDKKQHSIPMKIDKLGLEGDEHDLTFHGGPDKAILGYCKSHYPGWRSSHPERADRFVPGGFGENFVLAKMNERNVCIGDIVAFGPEVVLQVSLPRQPCFKLNHRFSLKQFAPTTYQTSRTGWYYRVIREGTVKVGDRVKLLERGWPDWTIERIQEYLHRDMDDFEMNEALSNVESLGTESRDQFKNRVLKAKLKLETENEDWKEFKIISRKQETPRVVSLKLQLLSPFGSTQDLPPGSHVRLKLPSGLIRSYSIVSGNASDNGSGSLNQFELGIALVDQSRGGSKYLHESAKASDVIQVGRLTSSMPWAKDASNHVFIAGGIGITAFIAMFGSYLRNNWSHQVHYAVRSAEDIPFRQLLEETGDNVVYYDKSKGQRLNIEEIAKNMPWNSRLYVCGPERMMEEAQAVVQKLGIPENEVHFEAFAADTSGDPFEAKVANRDGKVLRVGETESLLEVLRREFAEVPSSCEVGNCGTCKIALRSGAVKHRGTALSSEEKETSMLSCVSRGVGHIEIEI